MGVRVRIKLKAKDKEINTVALANAGFETDEPEVILPLRVAERLGLWPKLPGGAKIEEYEVAGGSKVRGYVTPFKIKTQVVCGDKSSNFVEVIPVLLEGEKETILSDKLISAHKIVLMDAGKGLWKFMDENKIRESENPEYW